MSTFRTLRGEEFRFVEASQESGSGSDQLSRPTHRVRGVVVVIEVSARGHRAPMGERVVVELLGVLGNVGRAPGAVAPGALGWKIDTIYRP